MLGKVAAFSGFACIRNEAARTNCPTVDAKLRERVLTEDESGPCQVSQAFARRNVPSDEAVEREACDEHCICELHDAAEHQEDEESIKQL